MNRQINISRMHILQHSDGLPPSLIEILMNISQIIRRVSPLWLWVDAVVALPVDSVGLDAILGLGSQAAGDGQGGHLHWLAGDYVFEGWHAFLDFLK